MSRCQSSECPFVLVFVLVKDYGMNKLLGISLNL